MKVREEGLAALRAARPPLSESKAIRNEPGRLLLRFCAAPYESELSTALCSVRIALHCAEREAPE